MVVHGNTGDLWQQAAPLRRDAIEREPDGRGDVQPLRLVADAESGFIHMLDRCGYHVVAHDIGKILETVRTILADPGDRRGDQLDPEQVSHQRSEALFRQQLIVQQIQHQRADPFAVLHRGGHPFGGMPPASGCRR